MTKKKEYKLKAWSYTRYSTYEQCPRKFYYAYMLKIQEPTVAEPLVRGSRIHDLAERYIKSEITRLPKELKAFDIAFKRLRKVYDEARDTMVVEDNWAFTKAWKPTEWDNWVHCWVRLKLDCAEITGDTMIISDWKTGKFRPQSRDKYMEQLSLYALAALLLFPEVKVVKPRLVYLDAERVFPEDDSLVYTRKDVARLKREWKAKVAPMFNDKEWAPRPSWLCNYCYYRCGNHDEHVNQGVLPTDGAPLCKYGR